MENNEATQKFCTNCGQKIDSSNKFCPSCGATQGTGTNPDLQATATELFEGAKKVAGKTMNTVIKKANELTGETGEVKLNLKDLVSNVFKKHSKEEQEELFICGTAKTTPKENEISSSWPKPWLYSRIFLMFAITFGLLSVVAEWFSNTNAIPGLIFVGALAVPFSTVIFFFEVNAPRNMSLFEVIKIFFVGGALSLVATLILFEFAPVGELDYIGATIVGIVEEAGKLVIVAYFCKNAKVKHILTGLLIGSAVGAGFAVFETAGYAFNYLLVEGWETMLEVIYLRAILSLGGHVVWAAISGAALVLVKGAEDLEKEHLLNPRFLKIFAVPVVLHAVWDMPIPVPVNIPIVQIALTVLSWVMVLVLINTGLKQLSKTNKAEVTANE
ncbi:MAG: PrsW family glutamic-type intramembrane protease [Candidatus Fimenecus sp.]